MSYYIQVVVLYIWDHEEDHSSFELEDISLPSFPPLPLSPPHFVYVCVCVYKMREFLFVIQLHTGKKFLFLRKKH